MNKIPVCLNIFKRTKDIKTRHILLNDNVDNTTLENPFSIYRNIRHPRERMVQFLTLHDRFYNNQRLNKIKIKPSPGCDTCDEIETNDHLFLECGRAIAAWELAENIAR